MDSSTLQLIISLIGILATVLGTMAIPFDKPPTEPQYDESAAQEVDVSPMPELKLVHNDLATFKRERM